MTNELHKVFIFFPDGTSHNEGSSLSAKQAMERAHDFIRRPAAQIGMISRVIVTDADDYTNFEWKYREGITFPLTDVTRKWNENYKRNFKETN